MMSTQSDSIFDSKTGRVWREAGMGEFPEVETEAPYREQRERLRCQAAVFKGWTAWQLEEFLAAAEAFHVAMDQGTRDPELTAWMLCHLLEGRADYFEPPMSGAWPERSLLFDNSAPGILVERTLPSRTREPTYNETTDKSLYVLHRLLLAEPTAFRRAASLYFAYHPFVEPVTGMVLAPICAGSFQMGSPESEPERDTDEGPRHQVTLNNYFWMGIYPVTQQQYHAVTGEDPSQYKGPYRPVETVSWEEADAFCKKLTESATAKDVVPDGYVFRLPTEAEWEYCCRAGTDTASAFGNSLSSEQANFDGNYPYGSAQKGPYLERTSDVGSYSPNAWGLYDTHGNVWEWCLDAAEWEDNVITDTYVDGVIDPLCRNGRRRVIRGGSWNSLGRYCRSACRGAGEPGYRDDHLGFRVCLARSPVGSEL